MQSSKPISSEEGLKLGLIDKIASTTDLLEISRQWAVDIADTRNPRIRSLHITERLGPLSEALEIIKGARKLTRQSTQNMPQYQACLDAIEDGIIHGGYSGVLRVTCHTFCDYFMFHNKSWIDKFTTYSLQEEKIFTNLVLSDTAKGLVHTFFAQRTISKVCTLVIVLNFPALISLA